MNLKLTKKMSGEPFYSVKFSMTKLVRGLSYKLEKCLEAVKNPGRF